MGKLVSLLKNGLAHPLTRDLDLDDPKTTQLRRQIIEGKPFLRKIYDEWYRSIAAVIPSGSGSVLELGSGGGFMGRYVDGLIASDVFSCEGLTLVADGQRLPFDDGSLRGVVMVNVLHHLPGASAFFIEAARCVRGGGVIVMVEPWVTRWSGFVYTKLHHEPFDPDRGAWDFSSTGPLSGANGALPWIMIERDRDRFRRLFPQWEIEVVKPLMPVRYLLSGGVSMRSLQPSFSFGFWRAVEGLVEGLGINAAMFAMIVLRRV